MTGQDLYDQAMARNLAESYVEELRKRLEDGPKTGPELWAGFATGVQRTRAQNAFLKAGIAEYVGKHWRLKRKP